MISDIEVVKATERPGALSPWQQLNIEFTEPSDATAGRLLPTLQQAQDRGDLTWWFVSKPPGWRLRIRPHPLTWKRTSGLVSAALSSRR